MALVKVTVEVLHEEYADGITVVSAEKGKAASLIRRIADHACSQAEAAVAAAEASADAAD